MLNSGVVDQNVDRANLGLEPVNLASDLGVIGHVKRQHPCTPRQPSRRRQLGDVPPMQHHLCTSLR